MADFPQLAPVSRRYNTGVFPSTVETGFSGGKVIFRHGEIRSGITLELQYLYLTQAEAKLIRDHYRVEANNLIAFRLPSIIWGGLASAGSVTPLSTRWKYAAQPEEEHLSGSLFNVSVQLLSVRS
jgi:hypothetical protein